MKKKYCVIQGNCTECGTDDYWEVESFDEDLDEDDEYEIVDGMIYYY